MKKLLLSLYILLSVVSVFGQQEKEGYRLGISTGYAYNYSSFLQAGLVWGKNIGNIHIPSSAFGFGTDLGFNFKNYLWAPKVFFEYNPFIGLPFRLNLISYLQSGTADIRLLPELGISAGGLFTISYGYGFRLSKQQLPAVASNRLSLNISLIK
jgi:hypothetical protein